jgi:hypothetical protein
MTPTWLMLWTIWPPNGSCLHRASMPDDRERHLRRQARPFDGTVAAVRRLFAGTIASSPAGSGRCGTGAIEMRAFLACRNNDDAEGESCRCAGIHPPGGYRATLVRRNAISGTRDPQSIVKTLGVSPRLRRCLFPSRRPASRNRSVPTAQDFGKQFRARQSGRLQNVRIRDLRHAGATIR